MRSLVGIAALAAFLVLASVAVAGGFTITSSGKIGSLQLGHSTRNDAKKISPWSAETKTKTFDALGWSCASRSATTSTGTPRCQSVAYASPSGTLEEFVTTSDFFTGPDGVKVGMTRAAAAKALHRALPVGGCQSQFLVRSKTGLVAVVLGAKLVTKLVVVGPHPLGLFHCIDR
jgi:hypothetical protein